MTKMVIPSNQVSWTHVLESSTPVSVAGLVEIESVTVPDTLGTLSWPVQ